MLKDVHVFMFSLFRADPYLDCSYENPRAIFDGFYQVSFYRFDEDPGILVDRIEA